MIFFDTGATPNHFNVEQLQTAPYQIDFLLIGLGDVIFKHTLVTDESNALTSLCWVGNGM